jgi:predicted Zn-dependent peptidase
VDPERVVRAVDEELDRLATGGPEAGELARISARWSASLYHEQDRVMSRMLALGARELLYGRAELAVELPGRLAEVTPAQVAEAAGRLRGQGRAVLVVEPTAADSSVDGSVGGTDDTTGGDAGAQDARDEQ